MLHYTLWLIGNDVSQDTFRLVSFDAILKGSQFLQSGPYFVITDKIGTQGPICKDP